MHKMRVPRVHVHQGVASAKHDLIPFQWTEVLATSRRCDPNQKVVEICALNELKHNGNLLLHGTNDRSMESDNVRMTKISEDPKLIANRLKPRRMEGFMPIIWNLHSDYDVAEDALHNLSKATAPEDFM
mmetsp:Transcript_67432/g.197179  ORF Transcript_67432/g.197179 Transcript_67432/m.197179 type:complete len:129 (-) Transcript_67432:1013-1399(-)